MKDAREVMKAVREAGEEVILLQACFVGLPGALKE